MRAGRLMLLQNRHFRHPWRSLVGSMKLGEQFQTAEKSEAGPEGVEGTTAWMQEVAQRMEQLPRKL